MEAEFKKMMYAVILPEYGLAVLRYEKGERLPMAVLWKKMEIDGENS